MNTIGSRSPTATAAKMTVKFSLKFEVKTNFIIEYLHHKVLWGVQTYCEYCPSCWLSEIMCIRNCIFFFIFCLLSYLKGMFPLAKLSRSNPHQSCSHCNTFFQLQSQSRAYRDQCNPDRGGSFDRDKTRSLGIIIAWACLFGCMCLV